MPSKRPVRLSWTNDLGQAGAVTLDAAISERHRLAATVTDHPIEVGPNVADFIRPEPYTLEIDGCVSNTPILLPADNADGARVISVSVEGATPTVGSTFGRPIPIAGALLSQVPTGQPPQRASVIGFDPEFDRVKAVFNALDQARTRGWFLTVFTTLKTYENMALVDVNVVRDAASGDSLVLTISVKQVRIANVELAAVPAIPTAKVATGNKPAKRDTVPTPPPQQESALFQLVN